MKYEPYHNISNTKTLMELVVDARTRDRVLVIELEGYRLMLVTSPLYPSEVYGINGVGMRLFTLEADHKIDLDDMASTDHYAPLKLIGEIDFSDELSH